MGKGLRVADLVIVLMIVVPPVLLYWQGGRQLRRGTPAARVQGTIAAYSFTALLPIIYVLLSNFAGRLADRSGDLGGVVILLAFILPSWMAQLTLAYPSYLIDRRVRTVDWSFTEYVRSAATYLVLLPAFVIPMASVMLGVGGLIHAYPSFDGYLDEHAWAVAPLLMLTFGLSGLAVWRAWQWVRARNEPATAELTERLIALGERLGLRPGRIMVMPTRGAKVANAFVLGLRRGRQTLLLTDYLVANTPADFIDAIFAHEVGHVRLGHLRTRAWLGLCTVVGQLAVIGGWFYLSIYIFDWPVPVMVLPVMLLSMLVGPMIMPILRRQEFAADRWAAEATGRPEALAAALEHLERLNGINTGQMPRWFRLLFGHTTTPMRVAALRAMDAGDGEVDPDSHCRG